MLRQFLVAPRRTGAVASSSRALARRLADLTFESEPRVVVEIGAGAGAVTGELAARARATGARLLAVELEARLARRIGHGLAAQADAARLPVRRADVVVSGIPFASLRRPQAEAILREAARVAPRLVLFQYTSRRLGLVEAHFPRVERQERVAWNLPPALAIAARAAR